ncbi:Uma2 family endonuclease [Bernardetia sp. OM2101]|uniref:Uma2 family endonuclease n=1 Tax=Bernardetia sp. OM2101 TaxID=3344876 RepID=UPI0035CEB92A
MATTKEERENRLRTKNTKKEHSKKTDFISEDEYLKREFLAETKSEYHAGKIIAMAGATFNHGLLVTRLSRHLGNCLEETNCEVITNDLLVYVSECKKYCYPDIVVVCEKTRICRKEKRKVRSTY